MITLPTHGYDPGPVCPSQVSPVRQEERDEANSSKNILLASKASELLHRRKLTLGRKALSEGMRKRSSASKVESSLGWKKTVMLRSKLNLTRFNLLLPAQSKSKNQ